MQNEDLPDPVGPLMIQVNGFSNCRSCARNRIWRMTAPFPRPSPVYTPKGDGRIVGLSSPFVKEDPIHLVLGLSDDMYRDAISVPLALDFHFRVNRDIVWRGFRFQNRLFDDAETDEVNSAVI
jgi:hypothetical protein